MNLKKWQQKWGNYGYQPNEVSPFRGLPTMERTIFDHISISCFAESLLRIFSEKNITVASCEHTIKKYLRGARQEDLIVSFNKPRSFKAIYSIYTATGHHGERSFDCLGKVNEGDLKELSGIYDDMHRYMETYSYHRVKLVTEDIPFYMHRTDLYEWRKKHEHV